MVSGEKKFENVEDGRTDDGRKTDALLYYKLTYEPKGSGELKAALGWQAVIIVCLNVGDAVRLYKLVNASRII